ncbi:MAG: hypothetical protein AAGC69_03355 [Paracraurococcus sp.]|jgi:hypothetical protein
MRRYGIGLAALILSGGSALAQTERPARPAQPMPPPRSDTAPPPSGPSGGVIQPPARVDPGIQAPAPVPDPRTTPVIPPPGTSGGDRKVEPR